MVICISQCAFGMSPHLPEIMETRDSSKPITGIEVKNVASLDDLSSPSSTAPKSTHLSIKEIQSNSGMLIEEDRTISLSNLPALSGLPLRIRSASLSALTELCALCFDEEGQVQEAAANYPNIFFLMHKWFTTSESLALSFRRLFEIGKPSHRMECQSILTSAQQSLASQQEGQTYRPASVVMGRKLDDFNGNQGLRSPSLSRTGAYRSNSVLIPRPACIGVEDDTFFFQQQRGSVSDDSAAPSSSLAGPSVQRRKSEGCYAYCDETCPHNRRMSCDVYKFRRAICHAVRHWITQFPVHFDLDARLSTIVRDWQRSLPASTSDLASLLDLGHLPSYDWIRNISVRDTSVKHCRKVSLVFNHLEPCDLAMHLTYLEHRIMRRISFQDYKQYAVTGSLSDNPRLERSVNLFNGLTQWVQCMVLSRSTPQQRAEVIVKLIDVTKQLKELRNFNSLMAVVGGLSHSSLARLAQTTSRVPPDSQRTLVELTEFLSSSSNFSNYRRALHECKGFKIPILGVHMKDLISLHVALSDSVEGGLINFRKMVQLSLIFQELQELQNASPPPGANMDLVNTLRVSLDLAHTEDEIYELSLAREPKDSFSPAVSPTKPALSGEWPSASFQANQPPTSSDSSTNDLSNLESDFYRGSSGVSEPDTMRKTLEQRMNGVVDAVFVQPKQELIKLMQRSHNNATETGVAAVDSNESSSSTSNDEPYVAHDFQEANSFRPCICAHCNGLLWGPLRQGYKCRECGLTAHKLCIQVVKSSCRSKSVVASPFSAVNETFLSSSIRTGFRRRKKLSSQSDVDSLESGFIAMDCSCDHNCRSPCTRRSSVNSIRQALCEGLSFRSQGPDSLTSKFPTRKPLDAEVDTNKLTLIGSGQVLRNPKRRSLMSSTSSNNAPSNQATSPAMKSSPIPIGRQRKCSLSFTGPCHSYPGTDPSSQTQSLTNSPISKSKLKMGDPFPPPPPPVRKTPCICHGHHN